MLGDHTLGGDPWHFMVARLRGIVLERYGNVPSDHLGLGSLWTKWADRMTAHAKSFGTEQDDVEPNEDSLMQTWTANEAYAGRFKAPIRE